MSLMYLKDYWGYIMECCIAQSITCLTRDMCLIAEPGVASSIPDQYHTCIEINYEIISMATLLPSADSRRVVVS